MNKTIYVLLPMILFIYPVLISAQSIEYIRMLEEGTQFYENREYDDAQKIFKRLVKKYPEQIDAAMMLGDIEMKKENWSKAKDWFVKVTKKEPNQIDAFYKLAICDREDGIGRDIVTQLIMWKNSKKHFNTVIILDSTYKQVYYEFSLLKRYQKNYDEAIDLCHKQLKIDPQNRDAQLGLFYYYDLFITYAGENLISMFNNTDQAQIDWLIKRNGDIDVFFIGEKYRRQEKYNEADSIFSLLTRKHDPLLKIPLYLAQVRLYNQMDNPEKAEKIYNRAINSINSSTDISFIFEDTKYILEDRDLNYPFGSMDEVRSFYRNIWNRKNPLNSLESNYRLAEHYRRLVHCENSYRYDGFRFPVNNPDRTHTLQFPNIFYNNKKFNHKGLVYIRYGPPDDTAIKIDAGLPNNESWLYNATTQHPKYIFHFEVAEQAPLDDWRLVPVPTNPLMLETRLGWDRYLDQYYMANSELDANSIEGTITIESVKNVRKAMNSDQHTWNKGIESIPVNTNSVWFLNNQGKPVCNIFISTPADKIIAQNQAGIKKIETGIALMDSNWQIVYKENQSSMIESRIHNNQFIDVFTVDSSPAKAYLNTHISNEDESMLGGNQSVIIAKELDNSNMSVSDLLMAYSIEPVTQTTPFTKHGLDVIPNPKKQAKKDSLVYFYYEIYNLQEIDGQSRYKIDQIVKPVTSSKNALQKFMGLFGSDDEETISISKEHQTKGPIAYEYTAFDFSTMDAGTVEIEIKIKDLNSGNETKSSTTFTLL